jgi:hypothetical protein
MLLCSTLVSTYNSGASSELLAKLYVASADSLQALETQDAAVVKEEIGTFLLHLLFACRTSSVYSHLCTRRGGDTQSRILAAVAHTHAQCHLRRYYLGPLAMKYMKDRKKRKKINKKE